MLPTLSERYVRHLSGITKQWGGPAISAWFFIGPGLLLAGTIFFVLCDEATFAWFTGVAFLWVSWFGIHMWMCDGIVRLLDAKDAEIEELKKTGQQRQVDPGMS